MKNSLVLYYDYADCLTDLNDFDFRCVIMSIIEYDKEGIEPVDLSAAAKMAFNFIKKDLDRNRDKWEDIKEKRSQAGKKGGAPSGNNNANQAKQAKTSKTSKNKQKQAKQTKQAVNVNVNVNGNVDVKDKDIKDSCAELEISAPSNAPTAITFPTNVTDEEYSITTAQVKEFEALYPAVNVEQELRNMRGWLINNPKRRKTASGILRFVNGWLAKEQNKSGVPTRAAPAKTFAEMEWESQANATEKALQIARARREQSNGTDGSNNNIIKIDCL